MALQDYFVWGDGGSKKTPEQLQRERKLAQAMIGAGIDTSPVGHWTQGAARMANALVGNIRQGRADAAEKAGIEGAAKKFAGLDLASLMGSGAYPSAVASGASPTSGAATGTIPSNFNFGENAGALRSGIVETAQAIGADPVDLATAISYETGGTFDPTKAGPTTQHGQHRGLIQFGEPQAQQYGVDWNNPLGSQLGANGAVASYFRDRGFRPGMSGLDLYSTINAGSPGRYSASDAANGGAPGSVADKWNNQMQGHRQKALALLGGGVDYTATNTIPAETPQAAIQAVSPVADPEGLFAPGADVSAADLEFARQATGPEVQPEQSNNFNERWNAGAVDPAQTGAIPTTPNQSAVPVPQGGPSAELLRQNDAMWGGALAPSGQAPQQAENVSGYFPPAPAANGPAMGSFAAMGQPQQQGGSMQQLLEVASDPWLNDAQRGVIGMALERQMQQNDPIRALQTQKLQAEVAALRAKPTTEYGFTTLPDGTVLRTDKRSGSAQPIYSAGQKPTGTMQEYEFAKSQGYQGSFADYQQSMKKAGANQTNVNVGDGEGKDFYKKLDEKGADMFGTLLEDGTNARSTIMRIDRLDQLLKTVPTGGVANFKQIAANYGLRLGNDVDNIQAAQALINQIVPQQRPAGSGPMSDADLELFKQSVPRIINSPGGNQIIIDTMRGIAEYTAAQGDIAARVANREIKPEEGRKLLAGLPNPLAAKSPTKINSREEFNALPSGAEFIAPDGSIRRKP
ncbi:flagellar biosynthesis protein FlgJ [Brucella pituitosa]|uniref:flagellar biosynthesis protein FlgJ n=1 Tax=Brucella pituitosa TaxID=571256 RepID=UPI002003D944|nr:flagellar biosynthesis protein FlgJ [Brucella pituitosa]